MDTRQKIVQRDSLPSSPATVRLAKGWFDALTAEHCEILRSIESPDSSLVVLVYTETPAHPCPLKAFDRAQLIAALDSVDWVCVCDASDAPEIEASIRPESILDVEAVQQRDVVRDVLELHANG